MYEPSHINISQTRYRNLLGSVFVNSAQNQGLHSSTGSTRKSTYDMIQSYSSLHDVPGHSRIISSTELSRVIPEHVATSVNRQSVVRSFVRSSLVDDYPSGP